MSDSSTVVVQPARSVHGRVRPPGDKSISHRYALLAALADGVSEISGYSTGADCRSTLECLRGLGVSVNEAGHAPEGLRLRITGRGPRGLQAPAGVLDAGNSGTTIRMFSGVLAAHPFATTMTGDGSLRSRPMKRIIVPLERMGARIDATDGRPPLTVHGRADLQPIDYAPEVPSAQVKSAVLLAGLQTGGTTSVLEPLATRDHTERGLAAFGVRVDRDGLRVSVTGGQRLTARTLGVPGDISAAAFWMVAAGSVSGSRIVIEGVGLNPTRTGIIDVVRRIGFAVRVEAIRVDLFFEKAEYVVPLRLIRENDKAIKRDFVKIFGLRVLHPQFPCHPVHLDSLPFQYLEEPRDRLGIRLSGHHHIGLRNICISLDVRPPEFVKIPQIPASVFGRQ